MLLKRTVFLAGAALLTGCKSSAPPPVAIPTVPVATVGEATLGNDLTLTAEFLPYQDVDVMAKVAGYVKTISVDIGDHVQQGQVLAVLEIPELQDQIVQDKAAIVMARQVPIVCHYAKRKVIWFPPSSDPQLLMEGIRKHGPQYVIVVRREYNYYLPSDYDSFAPLLKMHPEAFRLVCQAPGFKVFQVVVDTTHSPGHAARAVDGRLCYADRPVNGGPSNKWKRETRTGLYL